MAFKEFNGKLDAEPSGGFVPFSGELDEPGKPQGRGLINSQTATDSSASDPMGSGFGETMAAAGPGTPSSVLEGLPADTRFDPVAGSFLSNRADAEQSENKPRAKNQRAEKIDGKTIPIDEQGTFGRAGSLVKSQLDSYSAGLGYKLGDAADAVGATKVGKDLRSRAEALQTRADATNQSISLSADGAFEKYAPQILAVFPTMAVAGLSGAPYAAMFGIAEVQQYAEGRKAGLSPAQALPRAVAMGAAEVIGEKLGGTGKLIEALEKAVVKGGTVASLKELSGRMLASGMREVPSEEATYAMQFGIDKAPGIGLKPNAGIDDFIEGAKDTAIVAAGAGGIMAGGGMALNRLAARERTFADKYPVPPATLPGVPPAPVDPIAEIGKAQTVDQAIAAAQTAVQSSAAVDNISQILQEQGLTRPAGLMNSTLTPDIAAVTQSITELENANVGTSPSIQPVPTDATGSGMPEPGISLEAGLGTDGIAGSTVDAGSILNPAAGDSVPLGAGTRLDAVAPRRPKAVEESTQDKSNREWAENYQAVTGDIAGATDKNIIRAIGFASKQVSAYQPRAWDGDQSAKSMIDSLKLEMDGLGQELKRREKSNVQNQSAPEQKPVSPLNPVDQRLIPVSKRTPETPLNQPLAQQIPAPAAPESVAVYEQPDPVVQRAEAAKKEVQRQAKAGRLRNYTFVKSPFLAFLGKYGVALSRKADFSPDKNPMLSGYGPLFRNNGKNTDLLLQNAIEEHFLPEGADSTALDELISQQISGMGTGQTKRIEAIYSPDVADRVMTERMADAQDAYAQELATQQETAQNDGEDPFAPLSALEYNEDDASSSGYNEATQAVQLEVNALLLTAEKLGIDTDEIKHQAHDETRSGTQQDYLEAARAALKSAIKGGNGDSRQDAGQQSPARGEEVNAALANNQPSDDQVPAIGAGEKSTPTGTDGQDANGKNVQFENPANSRRPDEITGGRTSGVQGNRADGVSTSPSYEFSLKPDGTLSIKGDAKAIRETLKDIPAKSLMTAKGGILVGKTQTDKAAAILRGETPKTTAREAAEIGEATREADKKAKASAARAKPASEGLSLGFMPNSAEPITVKNGVVYVGKYPAQNFETADDITVPDGATDEQIVQALRDAGAIAKRQRVFGLGKPDAIEGKLPASNPASNAVENVVSVKPSDELTAEQKIRTEFERESRTIGEWHPIEIEHNGVLQRFLANMKVVHTQGKRKSAIHLVNVRPGRMLSGDAIQDLAYFYKLDGKDRLAEEGIPQKATEQQRTMLAQLDGLTAPTKADILDQQQRKADADKLDDRAQIGREAEGQTLTSQAAPEQRNDTSGDMFGEESDAAKRSELENLRAMFEAANKDFADATPAMHRSEAARIEKAAATMDKNPDIKRRYKALADMHRATADRKESGQGGMFARGVPGQNQTESEAFKRWSNDAPLVSSADAQTYSFKSGQKVVLEAYHGTARADRVGTVFQRKRATSGPMAYFTSEPELASSYAKGKADTSLANEDQNYETWFKFKPAGQRTASDIVRAWYSLSPEQKAAVAERSPRVRFSEEQEEDGGNKIELGPEGHKTGTGSYDYNLDATKTSYDRRGNPLKALVEDWLNSGNLFNDELRFMQVLKLAGFPVKDVTYDSPQDTFPFVYKTFVAMQKPLVTNDMPESVMTALEAAAKKDRGRAQPAGADMWDKNTRTLKEWVANLKDPANNTAAFVWTSIPDKVTEVFKSLGYDGIIDWSGKGGGGQHPVYIPFQETQVKSAIGNKGTFDAGKKDIRFARSPWRSALRDGIAGINAKALPGSMWADGIKGLINKGTAKADEVEWSGITDWLKLQEGKVSKEQVLEYLDGNGVRVEETMLGNAPRVVDVDHALSYIAQIKNLDGAQAVKDAYGYRDSDDYIDLANSLMDEKTPQEDRTTKYSQYQLPGGQNYKELLLTLPETASTWGVYDKERLVSKHESRSEARNAADKAGLEYDSLRTESYKSSHWDQKNILAHIRFNERTDADGKRVLFVEEIQSDWAQQGKKQGFANGSDKRAELEAAQEASRQAQQENQPWERVQELARIADRLAGELANADVARIPAAPFVGKTDAWVALAIKRMISYAAENGFDKVAFVNGEQSAERYDLSKQLESVTASVNRDKINISAKGIDGETVIAERAFAPEELENAVGKDLANKILADLDGQQSHTSGGARNPKATKTYSGLDLKVGGEGMKKFYDAIVPTVAKDVLRKLGGGQMGTVKLASTLTNGARPESVIRADTKQEAYKLQLADGKFRGIFESREEANEELLRQQNLYDAPGQNSFDITPAMREKAAAGLPMFGRKPFDPEAFSRMFLPPTAMAVTDVQKAVDELSAKWKSGPTVKVVATPADLPINAPADARGLILGDVAYIVASNQRNRNDVGRTLGHEAIGHYGLWAILNEQGKAQGKDLRKQFERNLQLALKSGNVPLGKIRDKVRAAYIDGKGKFNLSPAEEANEIAAFAVEDAIDVKTGEFKPGYGFLKQVWADVAAWLRSKGIDIKFTNIELQGLLVSAMRGLEAGQRLEGGMQGVVAAARTPAQAFVPIKTKLGATAFKTDEVALANAKLNVRQPGGAVKRIDYDIRDRQRYAQARQQGATPEQAQEAAHVGVLTMDMDSNGQFKSLRNIEVFESKRGTGLAEKVVGGIMASLPHDAKLQVYDILPTATGFWDKMGAKFARTEDFMEAYLTPQQFKDAYEKRQADSGARGTEGQPDAQAFARSTESRNSADGRSVSGRPESGQSARSADGVDQTVAQAGANKAVDLNGKPVTVYHGTPYAFDTFSPDHISSGMYGEGFYFTTLKQDAELYAGDGGRVVPATLTITNPASREVAESVAERIGEDDYTAIREELQRLGYDGVIAKDSTVDATTYVAFDAGQITQDNAPIAQTDTPAFKRWFGDSKVVDADGKPKVMYHGTYADFDTFKRRTGDIGLHFGDAATASDRIASAVPHRGNKDGKTLSANVMPVYLAIKNPLRLKDSGFWNVENMASALREKFPQDADRIGNGYSKRSGLQTTKDIREFLQSKGYDGVVYKNTGEVAGSEPFRERIAQAREAMVKVFPKGKNSFDANDQKVPEYIAYSEANLAYQAHRENNGTDSYIAFTPTQVKSAIGNNGDFDASNPNIAFARGIPTSNQVPIATAKQPLPVKPTLNPWRDATGRIQFAPGQWMFDQLGRAAGPMLVRLGMKAASPELRRQLRQMKIEVEKAQEVAVSIAKETSKMTEDERAMVSDLVEQELKVGVIPPAHAVKLAAMINDAMGRQTDELVDLGMLTKDSADKWRGKYLPRYYESKLKDKLAKAGATWADALMGLTGRTSAMKGIKGKNLKGRGLYETIDEKELADYEALGWEVRDPDYTPSLPSVDGTVQVWRDFSPTEREKMGEIRDAGFRFVMGYMQTQRDIALGRMFEAMAQDPDQSSRLEKEGYVQVPATVVSGTGAKVYGKLAGRWVPRETMSQLSNIEETTSEAWQMYRKAMAIWKMGKTAMNPVSHVNNIVSNLTMAHLAGVSYLRGDKYLAAARDFAKKTPMLQEAKDNGLFLGTISDTELMNSMPEELRMLAMKQETTTLKVARTSFDILTMFLRKPMGAAYQAEDTFFRYLIYKDARDRGVEPQDAVDYAQRYIFTYDDLPKGARMVRDFGIPFFSYTYKAVPALLHTALTHPLRMATPAAILWGINAAAYAIATGDDDDEWQERLKKYLTDEKYRDKSREQEKFEREHLPSWNKGTTALMTPKMIRLGMDEVTKLPLFIDVSRIIPGGDMFDVSPNAGGVPLPQPITPSHPLFTTAVAMLGNKDLFRGKDLVDKNDTRGEASEKRLTWLYEQVSPAVAAGNYHWQRGMNALAQANGGEVKWVPDMLGGAATGISKDGQPVQPKYAAMQTFGIKVRPMDMDTAEAMNKSMKNKMVRDIDTELKALQRLNNKGAIPDRAYDQAKELARVKKDRLKDGKTVDGDDKN